MKYKTPLFIGGMATSFFVIVAIAAYAHQSGCHRWHSCPSDSGSYVCGDLGYTSGCPINTLTKNALTEQVNIKTNETPPPTPLIPTIPTKIQYTAIQEKTFSTISYKKIELKYKNGLVYLSIPSTNPSHCIWQYQAGNHNVSYVEHTEDEYSHHQINLLNPDSLTSPINALCMDSNADVYLGRASIKF